MSFEEQFVAAVEAINSAVFSNNKRNRALWSDALTIRNKADLVYIDPPYFSPLSDNEYVRRYHFIEGIARDWKGVEIQEHTQTKKFKSYPTPFSSRKGALEAFNKLFARHRDSILLVSYSSNSLPTLDEMVELIAKHKRDVQVVSVNLTYSFANQGNRVEDIKNNVKEYLFIGSDG
jgi:DNA adenine methylase